MTPRESKRELRKIVRRLEALQLDGGLDVHQRYFVGRALSNIDDVLLRLEHQLASEQREPPEATP